MIAFSPNAYNSLVLERISQAERTIDAIVTRSPDGVTGTTRQHICAALSSIGLEHFRAILLLIKNQHCIGSAFALFRLLLEALVRSEWLSSCASDIEYEAILNKTAGFPKFETMANAVDALQPSTGYFGPFTGEIWGALCGFTHSGMEQILQRFATDEAIEPTYSEIQIASLLQQSTFHVMRHFVLLYENQGLDSAAKGILTAAGNFGD